MSFFLFWSIASAQNDDWHQQIKMLSNVIDIIKRSYVDEIPTDELFEAAINGMLARLDAHSALLCGKNYQQWIHDLQGENEDQGIPFYAFMRPGIAFIQVKMFTGQTDLELARILEQLLAAGMKKLILDLRGNPGGYFMTGVNVVDLFLPGGLKIVSTKGRSAHATQDIFSTPKNNLQYYPLIVLIDGNTASAAELVAGVLQYWHRALVMGRPSYGKGLIQSQYKVDENSVLILTTSRYYLPDGRFVEKNDLHGETGHTGFGDAIGIPFNRHALLPQNYRKTHEENDERNGGIIPDIIVHERVHPDDEIESIVVIEHRFVRSFADIYSNTHPEIGKDSLQFLYHFPADEMIWMDFQKMVKSMDCAYNNFTFDRYKESLINLLKSELAYVYWGDRMRECVKLMNDRTVQRALGEFE